MHCNTQRSNGLKLCDYVTLTLSSATTTTGNTYTWNLLGGGYYSDRRSQTCTVEISSGVINVGAVNTGGTVGMLVQYVNGGHNQYTSTKQRPAIGMSEVISSNTRNDSLTHSIKSTGELLCNPRPGEITLKITDVNDDPVGVVLGAITLKYTYYNAIESAYALQSEYTPTSI